MGAGPPEENTNAEKWTLEEATLLFTKAIALTEGDSKYDFIGEVARDLKQYREVFTYLKDKFSECKKLHKQLTTNLEANCFSHTKNNDINTAAGIINLKSNHGWTDRVDTTTKDKEIKPVQINLGSGINPEEEKQ